jgi:multiple antibiotic resistance protein
VNDDPKQVAFFPRTLPFTTGPGTIAVAITLGAERPRDQARLFAFFIGVTLAATANAAIIWVAYRFADRLTAVMGATARQVVVRLSAFLLLCIGVQIVVTAIGDIVMKWRTA